METIINNVTTSATDPITTIVDPATVIIPNDTITPATETTNSKAKAIATGGAMIGGGIAGGILLGYFAGKEAAKLRAEKLRFQENADTIDRCRDVDNETHAKERAECTRRVHRLKNQLSQLTEKLNWLKK